MLIYRVDDRSSLEFCSEFWDKYVASSDGVPPPTILVGNGRDVVDNVRQVTYDEGEELANDLGMAGFCETSAIHGTGITDLFNQAAIMSARAREAAAETKPCRVM